MNEWINVKDRLPESMVNVLCWYEYRAMNGSHEGEMIKNFGIGYYLKQLKTWGGEVGCGHNTRVIAWQPLPAPPKE